MIRCTFADIDLKALEDNFRAIRQYLAAPPDVGPARPAPPGIIAVVKANAYGHGAGPVGRALEQAGATMLACADIEEAITLREAGVQCAILVFGALGVSDVAGVFEYDLTPTISTPYAARALQAAAASRDTRLRYHLKIDTGMNRLGFRHDNLRNTLPELLASPNLVLDAVYTHFGTADDFDNPLFEDQQRRFDEALHTVASLGARPRIRHAANSAALVRDRRVWFDYVRPGLLLYGISPQSPAHGPQSPVPSSQSPVPSSQSVVPSPTGEWEAGTGVGVPRLKPVMSLRSRVVAVKGVRPGELVGYGGRFVAERPTDIAIVPAGYADGLDVRLGGRGSVLVDGRRAPIVGAVSMDMIAIDVTGIPVEPGDHVTILGRNGTDEIDVREMARAIGTIPYELLCRVGTRIERVYTAPEGIGDEGSGGEVRPIPDPRSLRP